MGAVLLFAARGGVRNLALCRECRAYWATVNQSNQFLPVTRPLSSTGEREMLHHCGRRRCGSLAAVLFDRGLQAQRGKTGILKPWGDWSREDSAQRGRPAVPDHWTGRPGGSGAQPPLHLIHMVKVGQDLFLTPWEQVSSALVSGVSLKEIGCP